MALNNLPDLSSLVDIKYNPEVLYDVLLDINNKLAQNQERLSSLESKVEKLLNDN